METPMNPGGERTVTDAELIRYLDGELDQTETGLLLDRIRTEPASAARLEQLRARSHALGAMLTHADPDDLATRRSADAIRSAMRDAHRPARSPALRAAAVILLLLAGAMAAPPLRAWIIERARTIAEVVGIVAREPATPAPAPAPAEGAALSVTFAVIGDTFEIRVPGAGGVLSVRREARDDGTIQVTGATITEHLVLVDGVRLEGEAAANARYELVLPERVATIVLRIGDDAPTTHALSGARTELSL